MSIIENEVAVRCRSDVRRLWEVIADTERMNRVLGLKPITLTPLDGPTSARYVVRTRVGGLPAEYEERPFEWLYPERFRIVRRMRSGPIALLELLFTFTAEGDGGATVRLRLSITPRLRWMAPILGFSARSTLRDFARYFARVDAALLAGAAVEPAGRPVVNASAFTRAAAALRDTELAPRAVLDRLLAFVSGAADVDASRIRPYALADLWQVDRDEVVVACLSAVRAGLLDLRWEVVCPSCRTASDVIPSLVTLSDHGRCQLCELDFATDLDDAVEATFAPSPAVRTVEAATYCIGGAVRTPHVLEQAIAPAQARIELVCPTEVGRYRLFLRGVGSTELVVEAAGATEALVGSSGLVGRALVLAPGAVITLHNETDRERHAKLERITGADQAARARTVTSLAAFRREFSHDVLRPGLALKVARVGLFFSDLTGSTQLYADAGDAAAFKLVHDHFDLVIRLVESHRGAVVKTIGDAVMAVFSDDLDGLVAAVAVLHAFEEFRGAGGVQGRTHIKLGVFGGSCYSVTANGVLDYFGQTVNVAARLQGEAAAGELVVEEALADRALAERMIPPESVVAREDVRPKGVAEPIRIARIRVPSASTLAFGSAP